MSADLIEFDRAIDQWFLEEARRITGLSLAYLPGRNSGAKSATAIAALMGEYSPMSLAAGEALREWVEATRHRQWRGSTTHDSVRDLRIEEWRRTGVSRERWRMDG